MGKLNKQWQDRFINHFEGKIFTIKDAAKFLKINNSSIHRRICQLVANKIVDNLGRSGGRALPMKYQIHSPVKRGALTAKPEVEATDTTDKPIRTVAVDIDAFEKVVFKYLREVRSDNLYDFVEWIENGKKL
jgi:hypothetical protein